MMRENWRPLIVKPEGHAIYFRRAEIDVEARVVLLEVGIPLIVELRWPNLVHPTAHERLLIVGEKFGRLVGYQRNARGEWETWNFGAVVVAAVAEHEVALRMEGGESWPRKRI